MHSSVEQRKEPRFPLSVPVRVIAGTAQPAHTTSDDISVSGIRFTLPEVLAVGQELEWEIDLPPELSGAAPLKLSCIGKVVRVERREPGRVGIAAVAQHYTFTREAPIRAGGQKPPKRTKSTTKDK